MDDLIDRRQAVYFTGETAATIIGLGGSLRHVIGAIGNPPSGHFMWPASAVFALLPLLAEEATEEKAEQLRRDHGEQWSWFVAGLLSSFGGPMQRLEFVAQKLLVDPRVEVDETTHTAVILGSPIYVAMAA